MATKPTNLPISLGSTDRQLLESVAALKGLKLSTWVRVAAIERSRDELTVFRSQSVATEGRER